MSNIKFTQLPDLANITAATIVPVVAANVNYTVTAANLQNYVRSGTGNITGGNISVTGAVTGSGGTFANVTVTNTAAIGNITVPVAGTINVGNSRIQNVAEPISGTDAATKDYVDGTLSSSLFSITAGATTDGVNFGQGIEFQGVANQTAVDMVSTRSVEIGLAANPSVTGNITANYFLGNGSQLTGLPATYGNANVATFMAAFGANTISTSGNITAANVIATKLFGDGSAITNITANTALQGNLQGNLTGNGFGASAFAFLSATGNVTAGNVITLGQVSATGNITGSFVKGNGAELTGLVSSIVAGTGISISAATGAVTITNNNPTPYGNANVVANLAALSSNPISTTGNITGGNLNTGGRVSATGNVTGAFLFGNGSGMTGLVTGLTAGSGISLSGSTGNVTITATGGGGGGTSISNGTSNVSIDSSGGNITMGVGGNANLFTIATNTSTPVSALGGYFGNIFCGKLVGANPTGGQYRGINAAVQINGNASTSCELGGFGTTIIQGGTTQLTMTGSIIDVGGGLSLTTNPLRRTLQTTTAGAAGTTGDIRWDANYIYVCTATNTWKRVALSSF